MKTKTSDVILNLVIACGLAIIVFAWLNGVTIWNFGG